MELTNRSLALLLVMAIAISIAGTTISLVRLDQLTFTGAAASDTGITNFTIQDDVQITFTYDIINFGTGYVNDSTPGLPTENCTMVTNITYNGDGGPAGDCVGFNSTINDSYGFSVQNDGNQDVTLNVSSNTTVTRFVGGNKTIRAWNWSFLDEEVGSCTGGYGVYANYINVSNSYITPCSQFNFEDSTDVIHINMRIVIPQDAPTGSRRATITALGFVP